MRIGYKSSCFLFAINSSISNLADETKTKATKGHRLSRHILAAKTDSFSRKSACLDAKESPRLTDKVLYKNGKDVRFSF